MASDQVHVRRRKDMMAFARDYVSQLLLTLTHDKQLNIKSVSFVQTWQNVHNP